MVVFVTAFIDFITGQNHKNRSVDIYLQYAKNGTLALKSKMIIICEKHLLEKIKPLRDEKLPTKYVIMEKDEMPISNYMSDRTQLGMRQVVCSKPFFVRDNIYDDDIYCWIDFGLSHTTTIPSNLGDIISRNFNGKICMITLANEVYGVQALTRNPDVIYKGDYITFAGGGMMIGKAPHWEHLCQLMINSARNMKEGDVLPYEEASICLDILKNPDFYDLYYGVWYNLLSFYTGPPSPHTDLMDSFMKHGHHKNALNQIDHYYNRMHNIEPALYHEILLCEQVSSFYTDKERCMSSQRAMINFLYSHSSGKMRLLVDNFFHLANRKFDGDILYRCDDVSKVPPTDDAKKVAIYCPNHNPDYRCLYPHNPLVVIKEEHLGNFTTVIDL